MGRGGDAEEWKTGKTRKSGRRGRRGRVEDGGDAEEWKTRKTRKSGRREDGEEWGIQDFLPSLLDEPVEGLTESQRLFRLIRETSRPGGLDDDFSLVVATFD